MRILYEDDQNAGGDDGLPSSESIAGELDQMRAAAPQETADTPAQETQPEAPASTEAAPAVAAAPTEDWAKKYQELQASIQEQSFRYAEDAFKERQRKIAEKSPALWREIYGTEPPPGQFAPESRPQQTQQGPVTLEVLQKQLAEEREWRQKFEASRAEEQRQMQAHEVERRIASELGAAAEKFPDIYDDKVIGSRAMRAATDELVRRTYEWHQKGQVGPRPDPAKVVADVAKELSDWVEAKKGGYIANKREVSARIVPGSGKPGAVQAGDIPKEEVTFGRRGTARNDLGQFIRAREKEGAEA